MRYKDPSPGLKIIRGLNTKVSKKPRDCPLTINQGDNITHRVHRHELPIYIHTVTSKSFIDILYNTNSNKNHSLHSLIIINKPSSIPVHPCGRYKYNTITFRYSQYYNQLLHPLHRLDKGTSGILLCTTDTTFATYFHTTLKSYSDVNYNKLERKLTQSIDPSSTITTSSPTDEKTSKDLIFPKVYLASVHGNFLADSSTIPKDPQLTRDKFNSEYVIVNKPIHCVNKCLGIYEVDTTKDATAKPALTLFRKVKYNLVSNTTLIQCDLYSGRTHQIRVHLKYLGYYIVNDETYQSPEKLATIPIEIENYIQSMEDHQVVKAVQQLKLAYSSNVSYCLECAKMSTILSTKPNRELLRRYIEHSNISTIHLHSAMYSIPISTLIKSHDNHLLNTLCSTISNPNYVKLVGYKDGVAYNYNTDNNHRKDLTWYMELHSPSPYWVSQYMQTSTVPLLLDSLVVYM